MSVSSGYMAIEAEDTIEIYECPQEGACEGLREVYLPHGAFNSAGQCNFEAVGIGCGNCRESYARVKDKCIACSGLAVSVLTFPVIIAVVTIFCGYLYYKSMFPPMPLNMAIGTLLSYLQALSVVNSFAFKYVQMVNEYLFFPINMLFDFSFFSKMNECLFGSNFQVRYAQRVSWPMLLSLGFFNVYGISYFIRWTYNRAYPELASIVRTEELRVESEIPKSGLLGRLFFVWGPMLTHCLSGCSKQKIHGVPVAERAIWFWHVQLSDALNAIIRSFNTLFVALVSTCLYPFTYRVHPCGKKGISKSMVVLVHSSEWKAALPLAIFGLAIYTVGFLAFVSWAVWKAPREISRSNFFRRTCRCLWGKYSPRAYWFVLLQLGYGLCINILPVISDSGRLQTVATVLLGFFYAIVEESSRPWKFELNQNIDRLTKLGIATFVLLLTTQDVSPVLDVDVVSILLLVAGVGPIILFFGYLQQYLWYKDILVVASLRSKMEAAERLHDLGSIIHFENSVALRKYVLTLCETDLKQLENSLETLNFTHLGLQPRQRLKWWIGNTPFQVCENGRLEGEVRARGIDPGPGDFREDLRILKRLLLSPERHRESQSLIEQSRKVMAKVTHVDVPIEILKIFERADKNHDSELSKTEFVSCLQARFQEKGSSMQYFSEHRLEEIFDHIDVGEVSYISLVQFTEALFKVTNPVFPEGYEEHDVINDLEGTFPDPESGTKDAEGTLPDLANGTKEDSAEVNPSMSPNETSI